MSKTWLCAVGLAGIVAAPGLAQTSGDAVLVRVEPTVETGYRSDATEARRELKAKVEMAARMACADSWVPRSTVYESITYSVDWARSDTARPGQRKAIARDISVRCR